MRAAEPVRLEAAEIRRHYHASPYATLVLDGGYEEAGDQGRFSVAAGDVLLHPAFSAHRDLVSPARTYVLDVPLPFDGRCWTALARLDQADLIIRTARRDLREASELLIERLAAIEPVHSDPADRLAEALNADPSLSIGQWASTNGFSREWLSRRFQRLYGTAAAHYRAEARARRAWRRVVSSNEPLAYVASECGFADQAHMTRGVGRLTGRSPKAWRQAVTSVQESEDQAR